MNNKLIYEAMKKDDLAEVVLAVFEQIKNSNFIGIAEEKNETLSDQYRNEGNAAYKDNKYQTALEHYNKALLFAPNRSKALVLAYSNRSALLLATNHFTECLNDIEICLKLNCPPNIVDKLNNRRSVAESRNLMGKMEKLTEAQTFRSNIVKQIFDFRSSNQLPCVSSDVEVTVESGIPKVVAARDVKVGAILGMDHPYVNETSITCRFIACHYCLRFDLNLIPCGGCCVALFCSERCKDLCLTEYHNIECQIISRLSQINATDEVLLYIKAAIKLKNSFKSWEEFDEASHCVGLDRIKRSEINEIYNGDNKFSLLNYNYERHFIYGRIYVMAINCANVIKALLDVTTFFPEKKDERTVAIRSFARILMYMSLHVPCTTVTFSEFKLNSHVVYPIGGSIYPLIGKLPHCCKPNTLQVALNNRMGLVATQPIKAGEELYISHVGHPKGLYNLKNRQTILLHMGIVCLCDICCEKPLKKPEQPTAIQIQKYQEFITKTSSKGPAYFLFNQKEHYSEITKTLELLNNVDSSKEYCEVFRSFETFLLGVQLMDTQNKTL